MTGATRMARLRAKRAQQGLTEIRGLWASPDQHDAIKAAVQAAIKEPKMTATNYFIAETNGGDSVNDPGLWKPCKAKSLDGAKRAAQSGRLFQHTTAWVGIDVDGRVESVARRDPGSSIQPGWHDVGDSLRR